MIEFASLHRLSDKNLIRWYRDEFEKVQKGIPITSLLSPGKVTRLKKRGITQKGPGTPTTILSPYGRELFEEILEEDDRIEGK